jgi:aminopeptidase N
MIILPLNFDSAIFFGINMKKRFTHFFSILIFGFSFFYPNLFLFGNEYPLPTEYIDQPFDVIKYTVDIDFTDVKPREMVGICQIDVFWKENPIGNDFFINLRGLSIDSVFYEGVKAEVVEVGTTNDADYHFDLSPLVGKQGDTAKVLVYYSGKMTAALESSPWGGVHDDNTIIYALGVGFRNNYVSCTQHWIPCFDHPSDKALFEGRFLVDSNQVVASCGLKKVDTLENKKVLFTWTENIPAATYLLTFAYSNFRLIDDFDSHIPIEIYCLDMDYEASLYYFQLVPDMIKAFEAAYGDYPFEKVGYVSVKKGSMEHQTMISMARAEITGGFGNKDSTAMTASHELAHQWWGDDVSPLDFRHAWINEAFAEYSESIWMEYLGGEEGYWLDVQESVVDYITRVAPSEGNLSLFDFSREYPSSNYPRTIYDKGAAVVAMLRYEMGDENFFKGIKEFLANNAHGNFTTESLQTSLETSSGMDLELFFDQWIYGIGYPRVILNARESGSDVVINVKQVQHPQVGLYNDFRIGIVYFIDGETKYEIVRVTEQDQDITSTVLTSLPDSIAINTGVGYQSLVDLDEFIVTDVPEDYAKDIELSLYPNPVKNELNIKMQGFIGESEFSIYNELGKQLKTNRLSLESENTVDVSDLPNGVYIMVVNNGQQLYRRNFVIIR